MATSFRVYIDESGDEGFTFRDAGGSSKWFVLSAVVIRTENDPQIVDVMKKSRALLGRKEKDALHFVKLKHGERLAWVQNVAGLPARTVSILIHKPSIPDPEVYIANSYHLYRYASRLLMERVSWFCREMYDAKRGDGRAEVIFSNRRTMSYEQIQMYWEKLRDSPSYRDVRIDWSRIDPAQIRAVSHDQLAGLQVADAIASAHWQAVSPDRFGNAEGRYFLATEKLLYRHKGEPLGYGLKFFPNLEKLRPSMPQLSVFDGLKR